jgi:hypothetical protein
MQDGMATDSAGGTPTRFSGLEHHNAPALGPLILGKISRGTCASDAGSHDDDVGFSGQCVRRAVAEQELIGLAVPERAGGRGRGKGCTFVPHRVMAWKVRLPLAGWEGLSRARRGLRSTLICGFTAYRSWGHADAV